MAKSEKEYMFNRDSGGLKIELKPNEVSWFVFLQASRVATSPAGGWNSLTHWQSALIMLQNAPCLAEWTTNSITIKTPTPRKKEFMFDRELSKERRRLLERGPIRKGEVLDKLIENEINTRLFHDNEHGLWGTNIGYETPLAAESDGQLKVDMLALGKDGKRLEIIELKKAGNTGDSPLMALIEAICYGIQVNRCGDHFRHSFDTAAKAKNTQVQGKLEAIRLILAAPKGYWDYWKMNREQVDKMMTVVNSVSQNLVKNLVRNSLPLLFDEQSICCLECAVPSK